VYPPLEGQEAAQVGSASALSPDDFVFPSFREMAAAIVCGVDPVTYLSYHRGTWHGGPWDPFAARFAPICVPLANQTLHAVGYAMGQALDGESTATLAYFGDGSASEGDFHEACNWAGVFKAPVVLFCQNNGWAISVPFESQSAGPIAARAAGYGFPGVQVDGNDVLAVWQVTKEAAERARWGKGPTLIEAITYRIGPHLTNDEPDRYRDDEEVERWRKLDPVSRYEKWLQGEGLADDRALADMRADAEVFARRVAAGVRELEPPPVADVFELVQQAPGADLIRQQDLAVRQTGADPSPTGDSSQESSDG
jgi:pyruvate dehydrogenase E1 component alpha subunit